MADPRGSFTVSANGQEYRLWLGMSVLADLQDKHGQDVLQRLDPPAGARPDWMPHMGIVVDLILFSLERFHADAADKYLASDIFAENPNVFTSLMGAAFPDREKSAASGNGRKPRRAA